MYQKIIEVVESISQSMYWVTTISKFPNLEIRNLEPTTDGSHLFRNTSKLFEGTKNRHSISSNISIQNPICNRSLCVKHTMQFSTKSYDALVMCSASVQVYPSGERFVLLPNFHFDVFEPDGRNRLTVEAMHSNPDGRSTYHGRGLTSLSHCSPSYTK